MSQDNIKLDFKNKGGGCKLNNPAKDTDQWSAREHGNDCLGSIKCWWFSFYTF
jgi:hypothetical protein